MEMTKKFELITRDLQEVVGEDKLKEILKERDIKVYWGTAPTGRPHLGYFVPMLKIADMLEAGCHVTILFADMHAFLDNMKSSWEILDYRTKYYEFVITEMLRQVGVSIEKLKFVKGTDFELAPEYTLDMYKLAAVSTTKDTQKAGAEVVKQLENPKMSNLLYPILQALDEQYLEADAQFGGVDQRKIFMFAREFLPKIGYEKRIHLMNTLIPGLGESGKMSSSEPNSKIDFEDDDAKIKSKINKAYSVDGVVEANGLLAITKFIVFKELERQKRLFVIERPEKYGGNIEFKNYDEVEEAFREKKLSSIDLKSGLTSEIIRIVTPLREKLSHKKDLIAKAYPEN